MSVVKGTLKFMRMRRHLFPSWRTVTACVAGIVTSPFAATAQDSAAGIEYFERKIRPLLANECYECHGNKKQKGSLRLDSTAAIQLGGDSGAIIEPGQPDQSKIVVAVGYEDDDLQMPPKKQLSAEQIAELTRWVEMGAPMPETVAGSEPLSVREGFHITEEDQQHWAFQPVKRPQPPVVENGSWSENPIDQFILAKLENVDLEPNEHADRRTLIRRAAYDLTGLPPTPESIESFLNDDSTNAWRRVINQLLDSQHYGEKWARHWLDLVRYAESNSYERDNPKPHAWRYRDYVIRSFNEDKPYSDFIREQLAGDEIPESGTDGIIATGYYRLGIWDDEPADRDLAFYDSLDDIIMTTSQTMLGITVDCARCHDHKIDPISQADYYKMAAFFRNINHFKNGGPTDEISLFDTPAKKQEYEKRVSELNDQRNAVQKGISVIEDEFRSLYLKNSESLQTDLDELTFKFYRETWDALPDFTEVKAEEMGTFEIPLFDISKRSRNSAFGYVFEGFLVVPKDGDYTFYLDSDDGSRLTINGKTVIAYDGIHELGKEFSQTISLTAGRAPIKLEYFQKEKKLGLNVAWSSQHFSRRSLSQTDQSARKRKLAEEFKNVIRDNGAAVLGETKYSDYQDLSKQLDTLKKNRVPVNKALAISEKGRSAPETHILLRGNPGVPGDEVQPGFPTVMNFPFPDLPTPAEDAKSSLRRLTLANWMTSKENQLTARVMVNRIWQHHFGHGIVRSPNNFGTQGMHPSHPELLDWLATEFMENGWRMKHLHRLIMTSKTYQMSSEFCETAYEKDPENNLLWRFNMRRLTAEELRDSILALNGTLNPKMYGPSIYVEIPKEVMATQSQPGKGWGKSSATEQARRSIYIHVKRSLLTPILQSFDLAETDRTTPVRFNSVQPTQALSMLNGKYLNDQADLLAQRLKREAGDNLNDQVALALSLATSRTPTEAEIEKSRQLINDLGSDPDVSPSLVMKYFCLMVMNLNEFVYLD